MLGRKDLIDRSRLRDKANFSDELGLHKTITIRRAVRFATTGIVVTGIHGAIAISTVAFLTPIPAVANGIAFVGATLVSYVINSIWSFSRPLHGRTLSRFIAVSLFGLLFAMSVAAIVQHLGFNYLYGIAAVAFTVPPITFALHNLWTFKS